MDTTEDSARNSSAPGTSASLRRQNAGTPWQKRLDAKNTSSGVAPIQTSGRSDLAGPSFVIPLGRPTPPPSSSSTGSTAAVHGNGSPCSESDEDEEMSYSSSQRGKENLTSTRPNIVPKLRLETSCLFCEDPMIIQVERNEFDEDADHSLQEGNENERSKWLKNLCHHLSLSSKDIPSYCSEQTFPLCTNCLGLVRRLWEKEVLAREVRKDIFELTTDLERAVADGEIILQNLRQPGSSQRIPENAVMLRDMIYEGYRTKLVMKQKLKEVLACGEVVDQVEVLDLYQPALMKDDDIQAQFVKRKKQRQRSGRIEAPSCWTTSLGTDENARNQTTNSTRNNCKLVRAPATTARREPATNRNPRPSKPAHPAELDHLNVVCKVEEIPCEEDDSWVENEGELVGLFYEGNSTLATDTAPGVGAANENPAVPIPMPMLKQEIDGPSEHDQIRLPDNPPLRIPKGARKSRCYNGIRFYQISRTETNSERLECGACSFSVNSTQYKAEKKLPLLTIREHILNCHSKGVARPSTSGSIQNGRRVVKKRYPSGKLWQRSAGVGLPGGQALKTKVLQPKKKKRNIDISKMFGTFHCPFAPACPRSFSRKCHLALHVKSHARKGDTLTEERRATTTVIAAPPPPQPVVSSPILPTPPPPERLIPPHEIKTEEPEPGPSGVRIIRKGSEFTVAKERNNTSTTSELCGAVGVTQV